MSEDKSQYLHTLRWLAAFVVVLGHAQLLGTACDPALAFLGSFDHAAVMVFFVLSGYVIAATVDRKRAAGYSLRDYFIDRWSRIYSVLIPAILLTIILDIVGAQIFPARYSDPSLVPQSQWFIRLLVNLFSLQGMWGYRVQFGTDAALWSVGYEFCYYVLFGLYIWRPRHWQIMVGSILIVVGPWVAVYGLIWALGAAAYRGAMRTNFLWALLTFLAAAYIFERATLPLPEIARDLAFSIPVAALVLSEPRLPRALFPVNQQLADFSYSTYAYHMPIMFLAFCVAPATPLWTWLVVAGVIAGARILFYLTEAQRGHLRRASSSLLATISPVSTTTER